MELTDGIDYVTGPANSLDGVLPRAWSMATARSSTTPADLKRQDMWPWPSTMASADLDPTARWLRKSGVCCRTAKKTQRVRQVEHFTNCFQVLLCFSGNSRMYQDCDIMNYVFFLLTMMIKWWFSWFDFGKPSFLKKTIKQKKQPFFSSNACRILPATASLIGLVEEHGAQATFFLCSDYVEGFEQLAQELLKDGHELLGERRKKQQQRKPRWTNGKNQTIDGKQ